MLCKVPWVLLESYRPPRHPCLSDAFSTLSFARYALNQQQVHAHPDWHVGDMLPCEADHLSQADLPFTSCLCLANVSTLDSHARPMITNASEPIHRYPSIA